MRIAALQMHCVPGDPAANLARIERAARDAASQGAALLIAPELALTGYGAGPAITALAEPADGEAVESLSRIARDTGLAIVAGFAERADGKVWNAAVFTDGTRPPVVYRKSHLYADYERGLFAPEAPQTVVVDHQGLRLGMLICYDVEFPENVRRLALAGVKLVVVPTALPAGPHAEFIARHMVPVRAFENELFVAYVNHCGSDARFSYAGLSTIAAPDGSLLAKADSATESLLVAEIRDADFTNPDTKNTYLADLRT